MLEAFLDYIKKEKLGDQSLRYLLMVSGGVDSMVMADLFRKAGFSFGIAHCNFKLRGKESEGDEKLVRDIARSYHVPFFRKSFNTAAHSEKNRISVQMSARDLRYEWLGKIAKEKGYDLIATAHHLDDSIETFFINILRGTGIAGLHGIPVRNGNIIRPMLFASKKMIREYAQSNRLDWREDSSNLTDKYLRNSIRHNIIPSLKKLNKGFEKTISKEFFYFKEAGEIFRKFIEEKKRDIVEEDGKKVLLNIKKLKDSGHAETLLHELLRAYDFTPETTELIARRMYSAAGKKFFSPTYRLIRDRDFFILTPKKTENKKEPAEFRIEKNLQQLKNTQVHITFEMLKGNLSRVRDTGPSTAWLDLDRLEFPLRLRKWAPGDFFFPLGMKGRKKLSDFFIDIKLPVNEKENTWVLVSGKDIVWVAGYRIDDRFKVLPGTKRLLKATLI